MTDRRSNIISLHRAVDISPWNRAEAYRPDLVELLHNPIDLRVRQLQFDTPHATLRKYVAAFCLAVAVGSAVYFGLQMLRGWVSWAV